MTLRIHIMVIFVVSLTTRSVSKPVLRDTTQSGRPNILLTRVVEYLRKYGFLEASKIPYGRRGAGTLSSNTVTSSSSSFTIDITDGWEDILLNPSSADVVEFTEEKVKTAIKNFQKFHSLKVTGVLDSKTLKRIEAPRCGVKDKVWVPRKNTRSRRKRYNIEGSHWPGYRRTITYNITAYSNKLTRAETDATIAKAFRKWAEVIPNVFRPSSNPDIEIRFVKGAHGDGFPFDGKKGELAHAFFPKYGGDMHFDDAESWVVGVPSSNQHCLLCVAVHEIGHSLGLRHSSVSSSLMSPWYGTNVNLRDDDITGIQHIYGMCSTSFDAIESWEGNGRTYIFKDDQYWRLNDPKYRTDTGYPQSVSKWRGLPNNIDEMLLWGHNWNTYFFKGTKYYRYNSVTDQVHYSNDISQGWPGIPDNIDAAFTHSDLKTYFFKGGLVYQFDNIADRVATGYPKKIRDVFSGLSDNIDTAFRWYYDRKIYFFKHELYYVWNESLNRADGPFMNKKFWKNVCFV